MAQYIQKILVIERLSILLVYGKVITLNVVGDVFTLASAYGLEKEGNVVDVQDAYLQVSVISGGMRV